LRPNRLLDDSRLYRLLGHGLDDGLLGHGLDDGLLGHGLDDGLLGHGLDNGLLVHGLDDGRSDEQLVRLLVGLPHEEIV
jgi:hypothetical protein